MNSEFEVKLNPVIKKLVVDNTKASSNIKILT